MLTPQADRERVPDLLRRLEREVGPVADAASWTKALPRSVLQRTVFRAVVAAVALVVLVTAWKHLPSDARAVVETTGLSTSAETDEISRLHVALADAEAAQRRLRAELDMAREEVRNLSKTHSWHEDTAMLTYRSPWRAR